MLRAPASAIKSLAVHCANLKPVASVFDTVDGE